MSFDRRLSRDYDGKCRSFFFFFLISSTHCSSSSHFCFSSFSFLFFSFIFFFFHLLLSFLFSLFFSFSLPRRIVRFPSSERKLHLTYFSFFPWSMCHMDTCSRRHSPHHMDLMPCVILPWCHVAAPGHTMWNHPMCHPTPGTSKNLTISEFNEIQLGN